MINWKVRIKNRMFWLAVIPALLLFVQTLGAVFGFTLEFTTLSERLLAVVNAAFALLSILGIVTDPTTEGVADSVQAMAYSHPKSHE